MGKWTVVRKCNSPKEVWQLWGGVMVMERSKRAWGESLGLKKCDSHQGGVKGKHKCQLMERCGCHDHGGGLRECGKVRQLSGGVTVLREV